MSIPVAEGDSAAAAAAGHLRAVFADAIRGALADVIVGPDTGDEPADELTADESALLDQYRRSSEPNRAAAQRTLELGIPKDDNDRR